MDYLGEKSESFEIFEGFRQTRYADGNTPNATGYCVKKNLYRK